MLDRGICKFVFTIKSRIIMNHCVDSYVIFNKSFVRTMAQILTMVQKQKN